MMSQFYQASNIFKQFSLYSGFFFYTILFGIYFQIILFSTVIETEDDTAIWESNL